MRKICKVTLNKRLFHAKCGDLLLDSAIMNGVDLPHDCRSGVCGACRVRLVDGKVFGGTEEGSDMIHACQARIVSDLRLVTEPVPEDRVDVRPSVASLAPLASDVIGVSIAVAEAARVSARPVLQIAVSRFPASAATARAIRWKGPRSPAAALSHPALLRRRGVLGAR